MTLHPEVLAEAPEVEIECQNAWCGNWWTVPESEFDPNDPVLFWCDECRSDSGEVEAG